MVSFDNFFELFVHNPKKKIAKKKKEQQEVLWEDFLAIFSTKPMLSLA